MKPRSAVWLVIIGILTLLAFVLPFAVFTDVDAWYGSFLFWTLATLAVIIISAYVSFAWQD